jgi:phosphate transport system substrate-binding protein
MYVRIGLISSLVVFIIACTDQKNKSVYSDTPESGEIHISVDESFRPVMERQIDMYQQSFPNARIQAVYKSEAECLRDFFFDSSTRLVIVGRGLTRRESIAMRDSIGYLPGDQEIATDAVVLLLHRNNPDTLFTKSGLRDALMGKGSGKKKTYVFDGLNATSTVRYIKDSILKGADFDTTVVRATKNSNAVMDYVAQHPDAVGVLGISWIGNPEDPEQIKRMQAFKLAYVQCEVCQDKPFVKPMQASMQTRRYPLLRPMHYLIKENHAGLGSGFTSFLKYERGQLIFRRAYLNPVMDFEIRSAQINTKIPNK